MMTIQCSVVWHRFLTLVPEELRSTTKDDFESYMADAQKQYRDVCRVGSSVQGPGSDECMLWITQLLQFPSKA